MGQRFLLTAPLLLGLTIAVLILALEEPRRSTAVQTYEIPPGTADKVAQGLPIWQVLPQRLETEVGEQLVVRNEDTTSHVFGPFVLAPGQSWSQRFAMSGDYEMTCSLYPTVDLVIDVAPTATKLRLSTAVGVAWAVGLVVLAAALVVVIGVVLASWAPIEYADAFTTGDASLSASRGVGWGAWRASRVLSLLLPGSALALVVLLVVSLSRVAPWRNAVASRALLSWMVMLAFAAATAAVVALAEEHPRIAGHLRLLAVLTAGLVIGTSTWSWLGPLSISASLMCAGIGLLGAASWLNLARGQSDDAISSAAVRVAVSGAVLVVAGVPTPQDSAPWLAARGLMVLIVGIAGAWWSSRPAGGASWGAVWLSRWACVAAATMGVGLVLWSWVAFVDTTSLPVGGNTVPAEPASIARGAELYDATCASCHPAVPPVAALSDRQLLAYATWRDGDHRFAFQLDPTARGDVVNYMRGAGTDAAP